MNQSTASMHRGIIFCWLLAGSAMTAQAQPTNSVLTVSLSECIQLALLHNLDLQIERVTPEIARYNLSGSYGSYDPVFNLSAREDFVKFPAELDPKKTGIDAPYELRTDHFGSTLIGRWPTGLTYELGGQSDFLNATTDFSLNPTDARRFPPNGIRSTNEYITSAALTLRQPLLRDFWIDAARQRIRIEKKNLKISELAMRQQIMNTVTKVELAYYELTFARERVKVEQQALTLVKQLFAETRKRVEVGDLPPLDEKQAQARVETVDSDLLSAEQAVSEQQNVLKTLLKDDFRTWPDVDLEPSESLVALPEEFNRAESWQRAMADRPDVLQFRLELEKRDITVSYQFNQLFPSLDLIGSYGGRAVAGSFGAAAGDLGDVKYPAYSFGVILSIPLSNRAARNSYKASQAAKKQALLQFKKLEQDVLVQIDNAGKLMQTHFRQVNSTRQARFFAESALAAEQTKLQNGASTSFIVLQLQQNLTGARFAEIRALADYNKSKAQLAFSEGSTLERNRLSIDIRTGEQTGPRK